MMERGVETAEGRTGLQTDRGLDSLTSHRTSPRKHCRLFQCVCVCHGVCELVCSGKMSLKPMTAMKCDVGGIDFMPRLTRR